MVSPRILPWSSRALRKAPPWSRDLPVRPFSRTIARRDDDGDAPDAMSSHDPEPHFDDQPPIRAAPPIDDASSASPSSRSPDQSAPPKKKHARIVPASPSYFSGIPRTLDDTLHLQAVLRRVAALPRVPAAQAPRAAWETRAEYVRRLGEDVAPRRHAAVVALCARLNRVHPALRPAEVEDALAAHRRAFDPAGRRRVPPPVDGWGRGYGVGRRKSSSAQAWVVLGEGHVRVNGKGLHEVFGRVHDRESVVWALLATGRAGRYNVWAKTQGGGTTGQAEALAMAVGRGLEVLEPDLKPALRRGEFLREDILVQLTFLVLPFSSYSFYAKHGC